ncbi:TonB-dependent receptor [Dyella silvatica]|uniref:TonB-dependent receptor n=1 Tax=Dyella silvatica TaxID=2992128 RepID=UPI0022585384|nr:TonB-dependent receptor [Dyella silvatica]
MARTHIGRFLVGFAAVTGVASAMASNAATDEVPVAKPAASNEAAERDPSSTDKTAANKAVDLQALKVTAQTTPAEMARAIQQSAPNIVNVLPATEIQKLPDVNAAEAVRRVPGISLESDTGEGRFVNIRGLDADLNGTTFGGVRLPPTNVASPQGGGRAVAFDSIPTGLIGAITVTKTNTPDQDAEALGGTIEITPKQVPPGKDRFFEAEIGSGIETLRSTPIKDYSLSGGGRFGANNAFSFIGTVAYYEDKRGVDDIEGSYADDQANGTPDKVMNDFEQRYYRYHRRRLGYGGEFNYEPDADNRWYVRYFDAGYTESVNRQRLTYNLFQGGTGSVMTDPNNPKGFIDPNVTYDKSLRDEKETIDTRVLTLGGENHFPSFKIDYLVAATYGSYNKPFDYNTDFSSPGAVRVAYDNISDPRYPRFNNLSGPNPLDPTNYTLSSLQNSTEHDHNQEYTGAFNVTIPTDFFQSTDRQGTEESLKFGVSARMRDRHGSIERFTYSVPTLPMTQFAGQKLVTFYDNHYQNGYNLNGTGIRNFFFSNPGLFPLANPLGDQQNEAQGASSASEDVYAAYGQYQFSPTDKLGVLTGVRWERTLATYTGNQILKDTNGNFIGALSNSRQHGYGNFFPTVQLRYELADDLIARGNYSKTIARPGFNQVTAAVLIDPSADNVTQGNPNLKPTTSDNFDVSLEYYLNDGGIASVGVFDKELSNYIINKEEVGVIFPNNGLFAGFTGAAKVFTFDNLSSAYARGVELNYQQKFSMLPGWLGGFGVGVNYTYVNSNAEIRPGEHLQLPSTSRNTGNLMLFYDKGGLNLNLGAYYVSKNIFGVGSSAATDIWSQARFSLDFGASYAIDKQWSLFLNAKNLTNTRLKFTEGPTNARPIQREFYEQTITVGARFKL